MTVHAARRHPLIQALKAGARRSAAELIEVAYRCSGHKFAMNRRRPGLGNSETRH